MACASGCSLPWSRLAARRNTSSSLKPGSATARSKPGLPSVSVPVLSTMSVSTLRKFSIAAASRNSTPCVAALPVATMIDIGVARPSAQGQAMMSTATALTSPWVQLGAGPKKPHAKKVSTAMAMTAITK
ncbi:hypothetical protein FQZ97_1159380 [compost metagenome]